MTSNDKKQADAEKTAALNELDHRLVVIRPRTWIALLTIGVLLAFGLMWSLKGRVTTKITGRGILIKSGALHPIVSTAGGILTSIEVEAGQIVRQGDVIARMDQPLLALELREVKSLLEELDQDNKELGEFNIQHHEFVKKHIQKQRETLSESIRMGQSLVQQMRENQAAIVLLHEKGLVSRLDMVRYQADLCRAEIQLLDDQQELAGLAVAEEDRAHDEMTDVRELARQTVPIRERAISLEERLIKLSDIRSRHHGAIVEIHRNPGDVLREGDTIATVELLDQQSEDDEAETLVVAFISPFQGVDLRAGMAAHIVPETVREDEHGVLLGEVRSISPYPVSTRGILRMIDNPELVRALTREGAPIMVTIELLRDETTPSGYRWTSGKGPPTHIKSGLQCLVRIVARERAPIDLVIPELKRRFLGLGDYGSLKEDAP